MALVMPQAMATGLVDLVAATGLRLSTIITGTIAGNMGESTAFPATNARWAIRWIEISENQIPRTIGIRCMVRTMTAGRIRATIPVTMTAALILMTRHSAMAVGILGMMVRVVETTAASELV